VDVGGGGEDAVAAAEVATRLLIVASTFANACPIAVLTFANAYSTLANT